MKRSLMLSLTFAIVIICSASNALAQTCPGTPGCLDLTFGNGGMNVFSPNLADDLTWTAALDAVIQNDGKVVVLARARDTAATFRNVLVRITPDGQLDPTFGTGGFLYIPSNAPAGSYARKIIKQTIAGQERFVLASGDSCGGSACVRVERFTISGAVDTSFGTGGVAFVNSAGIFITAAAVSADQKILLGSPQSPLIRLNANGTPDSSFGSNGIATFNDIRMLVSSIVVLPDGKIVTAGSYMNTSSPDLYVARFTSNGRSDGSFATQGKRIVDFAGGSDGARALAVDSAGRILAAGYGDLSGGTAPDFEGRDAVIVRLSSKGALDKTFGSNGKAVPLDIGGGEDLYSSIAVQSDGKILLAGTGTLPGNSSDNLAARVNSNGTLDTSFHADGWNLTDIYGSSDTSVTGVIQFDAACSCNKFVMAGTAAAGPAPSLQYIAVLRYIQ